jgi:hypothetical protein
VVFVTPHPAERVGRVSKFRSKGGLGTRLYRMRSTCRSVQCGVILRAQRRRCASRRCIPWEPKREPGCQQINGVVAKKAIERRTESVITGWRLFVRGER